MPDSFNDINEYLDYVGRFCKSNFGKRFRNQFRDTKGTAELAMLASPSENEYEDFQRAVKAMTAEQKAHPEELNDIQIKDIATKAQADCGNVSIFINGFILARKKANSVK